MKTFSHLRQYLAEFLEWEVFYTKVFAKIKTHILYSITLLRRDNVETVVEPDRTQMTKQCGAYAYVIRTLPVLL